jgi:hypothetical protein
MATFLLRILSYARLCALSGACNVAAVLLGQ